MAGMYKLAVGDRIEFQVKFNLVDGNREKRFGMRMSALRQSQEEQEADLGGGLLTKDYLASRQVTLDGWIGDSPLKDDKDAPVAANNGALDALYGLAPGVVPLVLSKYLEANGAKGRSGN